MGGTVSASPQDLFGFGPQSSAMGGTGAAIGSGFETVHGNPALLSASRERELHLGFQTAHFSLRLRGPSGSEAFPAEALRGVLIGTTLPIPFGGVLQDRVTLGAGFFTPTDVIVRGTILQPERPHFPLLPDRAQSVAIQAGVGVDIGQGLRIGAGFEALAGIVGTVEVGTQASGQVGTLIDDQLIATYAPTFGASYELGQGFRVGATYRGELEGRLDVTIHVRDLGSLTVPPLNIAGIAHYDPEQVQVEVGHVTENFRAGIGFTFKRWAAYPGAVEPTVLCPEERPDCGAYVPPRLPFRNTFTPRLGVAWRHSARPFVHLHFRGGAFFETSPLAEQRHEPNLFDNDRLALTLGYGLELDEPLPRFRIDLAVQRHLLLSREHRKSEDVSEDNLGFPHVTTSGAVTMAALVVGVGF